MVMEPGEVRRRQAQQRRLSELERMRQELLAVREELLVSRQRERQLRDDVRRLEFALEARDDGTELARAIADLAWRDREMRILRKQVSAATNALRVYAKQDERRDVPRSVAAQTLLALRETIPQEESFDAPPTSRGRV